MGAKGRAWIAAGVIILLVAATLPTTTARSCDEDWPTYRGDDQRTGACGTTPGPGTGEILWSIQTQGLSTPGSAAVVGGTVYFAADQFVYAVERYNGTVTWTYETSAGIGSSPAIVNGTLYIGNGDGYVYAIDTTDGTLDWRYGTEMGINSPPSVKDGRVVVGLRSHAVLALDAETGEKLWNTSTDKRITTSPLLWGDRVFIGDRGWGSTVYALTAESGSILWAKELDRGDRGIQQSPILYESKLQVGTGAGSLYTLTLETGEVSGYREEIVDFGAALSVSGESRIYISGEDGSLLSVDTTTGNTTWNRSWQEALNGPVAIGDQAVYIAGSSGTVRALNSSTGETVWETETTRPSRSPPVLADGILYVGSDNFGFFALDAGGGDELPNGMNPDSPTEDERPPPASNTSPGLGPLIVLLALGAAGRIRPP